MIILYIFNILISIITTVFTVAAINIFLSIFFFGIFVACLSNNEVKKIIISMLDIFGFFLIVFIMAVHDDKKIYCRVRKYPHFDKIKKELRELFIKKLDEIETKKTK